jgi:hypothetical protein
MVVDGGWVVIVVSVLVERRYAGTLVDSASGAKAAA